MAISCICHYRPAHKLVTAHLECRAPSQRELSLHVLLFLSSSLPPLSRHLQAFPPPLLLIVLIVVVVTPEITFLSSSLLRSIFVTHEHSLGARFVVMVIRWERRFDRKVSHKLEILREIPATGSRRIRTDPESSRSLSALINVVSLLIYRRVAGEPTNEIRRYHARTTLGIPWPGSLDKL